MDCARIEKLLDTYLDRELDRQSVMSVEEHLKGCGECGRKLDARSALSARIRKEATYYPAPAALASRIRAHVDGAAPAHKDKSRQPRFGLPDWGRWFQLGGAVAAAVVVTTIATLQLTGTPDDQRVVDQVLSGHSRSVLTSHQIDVASSDQHAVKPWLSSKLDFSPAVTDLTTSGFPLRGGRVDYVDNRPVAVLVYGHRQHVIDLFIWPADAAADTRRSRSYSKRGLNVLHWTAGGMTYWAVSDVNAADLEAFAEHYASAK
ncbi:MAG TPA: anti-sigma factor [Burkholderiales bacterium]